MTLDAALLLHTPIKGVGIFYNGVLHPVMVPAHLLGLIAVGLFIGQQVHRIVVPSRWLLLGTAVGAGLCWGGWVPDLTTLVSALGMVTALLAAASWMPWRHLPAILALLMGAAVGADSWPSGVSTSQAVMSLAGTVVGAALTAFYSALVTHKVHRLSAAWPKIGVRVAASWIAASTLLVLVLSTVHPRA